MNIVKISATAEIVSSVAILITLIYLAIETNQNSEALFTTSRQQLLDSDLELLEYIGEHPELFRDMDRQDLSEDNILTIRMFLLRMLRVREFAWNQYQSGVMDEATWQSYMQGGIGLFATDRGQEYLKTGTRPFSQDFVEAFSDLVPISQN